VDQSALFGSAFPRTINFLLGFVSNQEKDFHLKARRLHQNSENITKKLEDSKRKQFSRIDYRLIRQQLILYHRYIHTSNITIKSLLLASPADIVVAGLDVAEKPVSSLANRAEPHRRKDLVAEAFGALLDPSLARKAVAVEGVLAV